MLNIIEQRRTTAAWIFDLEDRFARERGSLGRHPRPLEPLQFWLVGQMVGGIRQDLPPVELVTVRNPSGYHLFFGEVKSADGRSQRLVLSAGQYIVRVAGPYYQPTELINTSVPMPNPNDPLSGAPYSHDLEPGYAYPFPTSNPLRPGNIPPGCVGAPAGRGPTLLRGTLHAISGMGIKGARLQVAGQSNVYQTDESGQWVLTFPDTQTSGPVTVHVDLPDGSTLDVTNVCVVQGCETSLSETALRGWVLQSGIGVRGASISVSGRPARATTSDDGSWFYYLSLDQPAVSVDVTAALPTGQTLTANNVQVRPRATIIVDTFRFP